MACISTGLNIFRKHVFFFFFFFSNFILNEIHIKYIQIIHDMTFSITHVYPIACIMNTNLHLLNNTYLSFLYECFTAKKKKKKKG